MLTLSNSSQLNVVYDHYNEVSLNVNTTLLIAMFVGVIPSGAIILGITFITQEHHNLHCRKTVLEDASKMVILWTYPGKSMANIS